MNVELSEKDIQNLVASLNSVVVRGEDNMVEVLTLIRKLRAALQPTKTELLVDSRGE